jgi:hypothetical protein
MKSPMLADGVYLFRHKFHQPMFITALKDIIVTDPISAEAAASDAPYPAALKKGYLR